MQTLEQTIDKVVEIMISDYYNGCDDYDRPSGLHLVAFIYECDLQSLRGSVQAEFLRRLRITEDPT